MAIDVIVGALLGAGIGEGISAATSAPKSPSSTAPKTPDASQASVTASTVVADQRAAMLNAGGVTDYTGGLGVLTGSDVTKTSLVGG